jgi:hypothetical protein
MNPAVGTGRIALLLIVTGVFIVAWSEDSRESTSARKNGSGLQQPSQPTDDSTMRPLTIHRSDRSGTNAILSIHGRGQSSTTPLPRGIASGTYMVVDNLGRTSQRVVSSAEVDSLAKNSAPALDHYFVKIGSERWHYIRIDADSTKLEDSRRVSSPHRQSRAL